MRVQTIAALALAIVASAALWAGACGPDASKECFDSRDCYDGDPCTTDRCDRTDGVCRNWDLSSCTTCATHEECDDDNPCTTDECAPTEERGMCVNQAIDCDDADPCTADSCDRTTGDCVHEPGECPSDLCAEVDCDDHDACTTDSCDPATGSCVNEATDCDDGDACTTDRCDPDLGCVWEPLECPDGERCFDGVCMPSLCTNIVAPASTEKDDVHPTALVCDGTNAAAEDLDVVGLAYAPTGTLYEVDGVAVSACVRAHFDAPTPAAAVLVVARGVGTQDEPVCGDICLGDACGTYDLVIVFGSEDGGATFGRLGTWELPSAALGRVERAVSGTFDTLLVCRSGGGHGRDNILLDFVAICSP